MSGTRGTTAGVQDVYKTLWKHICYNTMQTVGLQRVCICDSVCGFTETKLSESGIRSYDACNVLAFHKWHILFRVFVYS